MKNNRKNIRSLAVAGVVVGLVLAACGDPDDPQGTAAGAQLPAVLGPASQAAVVEAAVEAHANDVAARSAESARLQGQADENQGRAEASTEETSDGTHTGESVSDLRMR